MSISINPQTTIKLCTVPWGDTTKHTLLFDSKDKQDAYFNGLTGLTFNEFTYIRKDSAIKIGLNIDLIRNYNYLYYTNYDSNISDMGITKTPKTYYCFILGREHVNENTTKLYIKCDEIQTYMTEILSDTTSISYINRQHIAVNDDRLSKLRGNCVQENLETGDYIRGQQLNVSSMASTSYSNITWPDNTSDYTKETYGTPAYFVVVGCTQSIFGANTVTNGRMFGNIYSGLTYYAFSVASDISSFLSYLNATAQIDAIFNMFMIPKTICKWQYLAVSKTYKPEGAGSSSEYLIHYFTPIGDSLEIMDNIYIPPKRSDGTQSVSDAWDRFLYTGYSGATLNTSNSYKPHNAKLYTYPYCYLQVLNGESNAMTLKFEQFDDPNINNFVIIGVLAQGGSIVCYPKNYNGKASDFEDLIQGPKFPTCSWNTDSYTNWLTQTAVSRSNTKRYAQEDKQRSNDRTNIDTTFSLGRELTSKDSKGKSNTNPWNIADTLKNAVYKYQDAQRTYDRTIDSLEEQNYVHSLVPDSINNGSASPEVLFSNGNYEFKFQLMTITGERAKQIDEYFDRFGYIVNNNANLVQAIKCRNKWNYVKTAECNIKADIPDEDLSEIKTIFNEGITFWKDASYFYKYNLGSSNT
jgi:hypothetical protein